MGSSRDHYRVSGLKLVLFVDDFVVSFKQAAERIWMSFAAFLTQIMIVIQLCGFEIQLSESSFIAAPALMESIALPPEYRS